MQVYKRLAFRAMCIRMVVELKYCYFNSTTMRMQTCAACKSFIYLHVAIISFKLLHSE